MFPLQYAPALSLLRSSSHFLIQPKLVEIVIYAVSMTLEGEGMVEETL